ncbi:MAG: hypothetical protein ACYCZX_01665 [Rhodospirillaceae bacterium]
MPIDPITPKAPTAPIKPAAKSLNDPSFGTLVQQDLKTGLKSGPKLSEKPTDGFKSMKTPEHFLPLNRNAGAPSPPLTAASVEALGATTKHPLGPQKP